MTSCPNNSSLGRFPALSVVLFALAIFFLDTARASFSQPFFMNLSSTVLDGGGFACCLFGDSLYCLGGASEIFSSGNLTAQPLIWNASGMKFPHMHML